VSLFRAGLAIFVTAAVLTPSSFASHVRRAPTAGTSTHRSHRATGRTSHRLHGQQTIDTARATQIQQALIREHYMAGEPTGNWDAGTVAAMQKFQSANGWQTKLMPDSRALKKLGLGPDYSGAINAQSASFSEPPPVSTIPSNQASGFTAASGVNQ
jgi:peptidoglycan hydrolase-like protein with peptidoglycan-binding domain